MRAAQKIKSPITAGVAKVPVVMQMEALECGAASLAMILAYYEKWVPLGRRDGVHGRLQFEGKEHGAHRAGRQEGPALRSRQDG